MESTVLLGKTASIDAMKKVTSTQKRTLRTENELVRKKIKAEIRDMKAKGLRYLSEKEALQPYL